MPDGQTQESAVAAVTVARDRCWHADEFLASLSSLSTPTRDAYASDVDQFLAWAERGGCADPAHIDRRILRRYLAYLDTRGFAPTSIARKAAALRSYLRYLRRHGVIDTDPSTTMRTPKGASRLPRVIRSEEAADLLDDVSATVLDDGGDPVTGAVLLRDIAVLEVLYGAGLRVAECCGLRTSDVDHRRGLVTVLGKGAKVRRVPLGEPALTAISDWLARGRPLMAGDDSPADVVFLNRRGRALSTRDARRYASSRGRSGLARSARTARPCRSCDDPDLHPRDPRPTPSRLRLHPSPCLTTPTPPSPSSGPTTRPTERPTRASG
jgi:integrase/recombinase XerC